MRKILFVLFMVLGTSTVYAQGLTQFQALYIYNFAKNIGWPEIDNSKDLVVTIISNTALSGELKKLSQTRKIGNRTVIVKDAATLADVAKSDIIYLDASKAGQIGQLVNSQKGNRVLIVSDKGGHCANGAGISFVTEGEKLKYEISKANIEKCGLDVSSQLLQLGKSVD
ncbi:MAG: YfiR family protein [Salinivirgaceae bacterium]|nr:YfiR family protein [Salinivirgaceae bacterium]